MDNAQETKTELSFMEITVGLKLAFFSLLAIQLIFQLITLLYIQVNVYFNLATHFSFLAPKLLSYFTWDMWFIALLLCGVLFVYAYLKKTTIFPLHLLIIYPAVLMFFAIFRQVSFLQVAIFSLVACALVIQVNYLRNKQLELLNS